MVPFSAVQDAGGSDFTGAASGSNLDGSVVPPKQPGIVKIPDCFHAFMADRHLIDF